MPKGKDGSIEVYLESRRADVGWVRLPMKREQMEAELERLTGSRMGTDYTISSYVCPYFEISEYENIELLNTVADLIEKLPQEEKLLLKGWCNVHEQGVPDLAEIGSAALQISEGKLEYRNGLVETEDLGVCIAEERGYIDEVRKITESKLGTDTDYIDYEAIGRDFETNNSREYYYKDFDGNLAGYIMSDENINEFLYTQEEFLNHEWEVNKEQAESPLQKCMKRTAGRTAPRERGDRGYERSRWNR